MANKKIIYGKQHYVSQFYLRGFANNKEQAWVFNKPEDKIHLNLVRNIAAEYDYFKLEGAEEALSYYNIEIDPNILDKQLSLYEIDIAPIIRQIVKNGNLDSINRIDFKFLLDFIAWLMVANPATKRFIKNKNNWFTNTQNISYILSFYRRVITFFYAKSWAICTNKNNSLITSDNPVGLHVNLKGQLNINDLSEAEIFFALSPSILLMGKPNNTRSLRVYKPRELFESEINYANCLMYKNANRFLISSNEVSFNSLLSYSN